MTTYPVLNTDSGATLVNAVNVLAQNPGDVVTIQGGASGTLKEYLCTPSGTTSLLRAKQGVTITGDGKDRVRINTALQLPPGGSWSGPSGGRWTWTGTIPGPTSNTDLPAGGFLFPQMQYYETVYADGIPLWKIGVKLSGGAVSPPGRVASQVGTSVANANLDPSPIGNQLEPPNGPSGGIGSGPLTSLYAGQCFIDYAAGTITTNVDPSLHKMEISRAAANIFDSQNADVSVLGLEAYGGAIGFRAGGSVPNPGGDNQLFQDVRAWACSRAATSAPPADSLNVVRLEAGWCQQYGFNGQGDFMVISEPYVHHCNHGKLYNTGGGNYGSGGSKFVGTGQQGVAGSGITLTAPAGRYGLFEYNEGSGAWCDLSNIEYLIERQVCRHLGGHGIHNEISYKGVLQDNIIYDVLMSGIYNSTSRDVNILRNKLWLCGQGANEQWALRNNDVSRSQTAVWGTHRGTNVLYQDNEVWLETANAALKNGGQEGFADNLGWTTVSWITNLYHVDSAVTRYNWQGGALNYAGWQASGNDVGSVRQPASDPYPADPINPAPPTSILVPRAIGSVLHVGSV